MNTTSGPQRTAEFEAFLDSVHAAPYRFDLWHLLRWIDAKSLDSPPLGRSPVPRLEAVRVGQEPSLAFAPAQLHAFEPGGEGSRPRLSILGFGLFGPNGPLPIHLTEFARERLLAHDGTFVRFCDLIIHHRFTLFFYRAWANTQPTVSLDRPGHQSFTRYLGSLIHFGDDTLRDRDPIPDHAKLFGAGHLVREARNAEGLQRLLETFFRVRVEVEQWIFQWLFLAREQRTRLGGGRPAEQLGVGAVAGASVPDAQCKFRLRVGPLSLAEYESHLPGGRSFPQMLAWLRTYIGIELAWDARFVLKRHEVPSARLGGSGRLGWTTWLGKRHRVRDADDLVLAHENWALRAAAQR